MSIRLSTAAMLVLAISAAACSRTETPVTADPSVTTERVPASTAPVAEQPAPASPTARASEQKPVNASLAKWMGKWTGVEGTYLKIEPADAFYGIEIADLDGPKTYQGTGQGDHITFERNGKLETIRATDGDGTGMKWLAGKKDCLVVTKGSEGFCRD